MNCALILAGGAGTRLWPLSTDERPKQFLRLFDGESLLQKTAARLRHIVEPASLFVSTNERYRALVAEQLPDLSPENVLVEPRPLGTAAALAWGASEIARRAGPETIFCTLHADLAVGFPELFRHALGRAGRVAATSPSLVAIGVQPTRPETGFGYMRVGATLGSGSEARAVTAFVEKPGPVLAEALVADGALWNAGVFVWRAGVVLDALKEHAREIADGLDALEAQDFERFAGTIQHVSIERGLLERSDRVVAVPGDFGWDDVGTWASLGRARELDDFGNGAVGSVHFVESSSNVVHCERGSVVLYGVAKMLVVTLDGITFVAPLDKAAELRPLLDSLPPDMRTGHAPPR